MLERGKSSEIFYYGEEISGFDIIPVDDFPLFEDASKLEDSVKIEILNREGETHIFNLGDELIPLEIPARHLLVKVSTNRRSLDGFWNTFDALCEYDDPKYDTLLSK